MGTRCSEIIPRLRALLDAASGRVWLSPRVWGDEFSEPLKGAPADDGWPDASCNSVAARRVTSLRHEPSVTLARQSGSMS